MPEKVNGKLSELPTKEWLAEHSQPNDILLAHALDGVIWGKIVNGKLVTSAPINIATLQEFRLFNDKREIHGWWDGIAWYGYEKDETGIKKDDYIDEQHILWGVSAKKVNDLFTRLEDGAQGLHHSVPIDATWVNNKKRRLCLNVRHYFGEDDKGVNYIAYSRLTRLEEYQDGKK